MRSILIAFQFLTRLPLGIKTVEPPDLARSMRFFPLVGLFIGLFLVLFKTLSLYLGFSGNILAALLLLALTAFSGALHLDGLADMCDGFYNAKSKEETLKIMRDPHIGVMGVIGVVFILLMKWSLLTGLPVEAVAYFNVTLILVPVLSRWAMVFAAWLGPYAAAEGTAEAFVNNIKRQDLFVATVITLIIIAALSVIYLMAAFLLIMAALMVVLTTVIVSRKRLGGITGDILGAINEMTETAVLFGAYLIYLL